MKKIFCYILCCVVLGLTGCESMLDLEPKNGVTFDHYFRDENDLNALIRQMNADLRTRFVTVSYQEHMGIKADRFYDAADFEKVRNRDVSFITNNSSQQQWKGYYNVLSLVDLFFDNYTKAAGVSQSRRDFYLGQCYFIRAVCYFALTRTWGDAVITKSSQYVAPYPKNPAHEVLDTAIASAERAFRLLPSYENLMDQNNKKLTSRQYGSKGSAAALLAHMYAWKGSLYGDDEALQQAVAWADRLIEPQYQEEVGKYELAQSAAEVCTKVMKRNSSEGIFEIEVNYTDVSYFGYFFPGSYFISYPVLRNTGQGDVVKKHYGILRTTVNDMYETNDQRRTEFFYEPDSVGLNAADLAYLYKWRDPMYEASGNELYWNGMDCNRVIYRLADIYLLRAECYSKMFGWRSKAIADLNTIRRLRGAAEFPNGKKDNGGSDLQWSIFLEREKELLYEGHRYYDAIRNGYYGVNNRHKNVLSAAFDQLTDQEIKNGALYLPIPETAFKNNDLMIQNTYWMSKMN